jgi:hypothetical protein
MPDLAGRLKKTKVIVKFTFIEALAHNVTFVDEDGPDLVPPGSALTRAEMRSGFLFAVATRRPCVVDALHERDEQTGRSGFRSCVNQLTAIPKG